MQDQQMSVIGFGNLPVQVVALAAAEPSITHKVSSHLARRLVARGIIG
jgi:hypothetical protein